MPRKPTTTNGAAAAKPAIATKSTQPVSPCLVVWSLFCLCLAFCSTNSIFSCPLYASDLLAFFHQVRYRCHLPSLIETIRPSLLLYSTVLVWRDQYPSFHHCRLGQIFLGPTAFVSNRIPSERTASRGHRQTLPGTNNKCNTSPEAHTYIMSTLSKRQSPLDDTSSADYDNYPDSYGYDPSTCYEEHTCSWWWSSVSLPLAFPNNPPCIL